MKIDKQYINEPHSTEGPSVLEDQAGLVNQIGFKCRSGVGKLIFAAITCRPEIMYSVIKLIQFSQKPSMEDPIYVLVRFSLHICSDY